MKKWLNWKVIFFGLYRFFGAPFFILRELLFSFEENGVRYLQDGIWLYRAGYRPKSRKIVATVFVSIFVIAFYYFMQEAIMYRDYQQKVFDRLVKLLDPTTEDLNQLRAIAKEIVRFTIPVNPILTWPVIVGLGGMASTAVGWYTWSERKSKSKKDNIAYNNSSQVGVR